MRTRWIKRLLAAATIRAGLLVMRLLGCPALRCPATTNTEE